MDADGGKEEKSSSVGFLTKGFEVEACLPKISEDSQYRQPKLALPED